MQKKLIALAVAALAGSAAYADNVVLYGKVDGGIEVVKAKGNTTANDIKTAVRVTGNDSYFGLKGRESLGGGLNAIFQLESQVRADSGSGTLTSRDSFVGLNGGFGTAVVGTVTGTSRWIGEVVDFGTSFANTQNTTYAAAIYGQAAGGVTGADERLNNALLYVSPSFGGAQFTAAYTAQNEARTLLGSTTSAATENKQGAGYEFGIRYTNNLVEAGLSYLGGKTPIDIDPFQAAGTTNDYNLKNATIRGGVAVNLASQTRIAALVDHSTVKLDYINNANPVEKYKRTAFSLGVGQGFGANKVWLQGSYAGKLKTTINGVSTSATDGTAFQMTLGYAHDLSKRTAFHAYATQIKNKSGVAYDFYGDRAIVENNGLTNGSDPLAIGLGLRHTF